MAKSGNGSEFHVVLSGLKLPAEVEQRIGTRIRQLVMEELGSLDFKGDLQISPRDKFPKGFELGGHTQGLWAVLQEERA